MDNAPHTNQDTPSLCTRVLARAAQLWAIGGAVFFAPGAFFLMLFALIGMGSLGFLMLLPIGATLYGAFLFYAAGAALRRGQPQWRGRLILAPLITWNVLVVFSVAWLWQPVEMAFTNWDRFAMEYVRVGAFNGYLLVGAALHVVVNSVFLLAACFVRTRPRTAAA